MLVLDSMEAKRSLSLAHIYVCHHFLGYEVFGITILVIACRIYRIAKQSFVLVQRGWQNMLAIQSNKELMELFLWSTQNVIKLLGFENSILGYKFVLETTLLFLDLKNVKTLKDIYDIERYDVVCDIVCDTFALFPCFTVPSFSSSSFLAS